MNFLKLHELLWTPVYHRQVPQWQAPLYPQLRTAHPVTTRSSAAAPMARHHPALQRAPTAPVSLNTLFPHPQYVPAPPALCLFPAVSSFMICSSYTVLYSLITYHSHLPSSWKADVSGHWYHISYNIFLLNLIMCKAKNPLNSFKGTCFTVFFTFTLTTHKVLLSVFLFASFCNFSHQSMKQKYVVVTELCFSSYCLNRITEIQLLSLLLLSYPFQRGFKNNLLLLDSYFLFLGIHMTLLQIFPTA